MDTMQVNKVFAAVLVSGIAFFVAGRIGVILVPDEKLATTHIKIDVPQPAGAAAPAAPEPSLNTLLASSDPKAGAAVFAQAGCVACHSVGEGGKAGVGPNLWGVMGAVQGGRPGFSYSTALSGKGEKGGKWDFAELNKWITKPAAYAPGTKMSFAGLPDAKKRAEVIAYLNTLEANPLPMPAPDQTAAAAPAAGAPAAPAGAEPLPVLLAKADPAAGQKSTLQLGCIACHSFNEGGKNGLGPNLYGVVGRPQASHEGFTYSAALKAKGGDWTFDNINTWLTKPAAYAPGTKMSFAGIADPQVRANVIAYLRTLSATPVELPKP
jgi:cytochrome c